MLATLCGHDRNGDDGKWNCIIQGRIVAAHPRKGSHLQSLGVTEPIKLKILQGGMLTRIMNRSIGTTTDGIVKSLRDVGGIQNKALLTTPEYGSRSYDLSVALTPPPTRPVDADGRLAAAVSSAAAVFS